MIPIDEVLAVVASKFDENLTPVDRLDVNDVLDAALEWQAGRLPLEVFVKIGGCYSPVGTDPSPGYTRYLAMTATVPSDPRRVALRQAVDAILRYQGFVLTTAGMFSPADIPDIPIMYRRSA